MSQSHISNASIRPIEFLSESFELVKPNFILLVGMSALVLILTTYVPFGLMVGPMFCGFYLVYFRMMRGETLEFGDLFKGFDYFVESLIVSVILAVGVYVLTFFLYLMVILGFVGGIGAFQQNGAGIGVIFMLFILMLFIIFVPMILVSLLFVFSYPLIVDKNMKAIDAMTLSFEAVKDNLGGVFLVVLVNGGLSFLAAMFCYIPIFLVFPITFGSMVLTYRAVFPQ